ncbi:MAG: glycosyltransferase family 4 protein [Roseiflexaceae bacterium]
MRIIICNAQVPFVRGGAELLVEGLRDALRQAGHTVDTVSIPYRWQPHQHLLDSMLAWRMIDLTEVDGKPVDLVIATKFPSYFVQHPNKVVWLVHQHRQAYDWYGTSFSDFSNTSDDRTLRDQLIRADTHALREAKAVYTISQNVAKRLKRFNFIDGTPLYPPSKYSEQLYGAEYGDYILSDARLDAAKRLDMFVAAAALMRHPIKIIMTSVGPLQAQLAAQIHHLGLQERVIMRGFVSDEELVELYAHARAVYYAPFDEDYGFTTVQAMQAARPVITTHDAGGTLEFVRHQHNGLVVDPTPHAIAQALDAVAGDINYAQTLGSRGPDTVDSIGWQQVVQTLVK